MSSTTDRPSAADEAKAREVLRNIRGRSDGEIEAAQRVIAELADANRGVPACVCGCGFRTPGGAGTSCGRLTEVAQRAATEAHAARATSTAAAELASRPRPRKALRLCLDELAA